MLTRIKVAPSRGECVYVWVVNNARVPTTMRERYSLFVVKCLSKIRAFAIGFSITYKNGISHILFSSLCVIRRFL